MKVLQIYKTYTPDTFGGIEQVIRSINIETTRMGAEHTLLTTSHQARQDQIDGLPIIRCKKNVEIASCPFSFNFLKQFKKISQAFDVLHFHYPWPFADLTYLLCSVDKPALVTFHADALKHHLLKKIYAPVQHAFLKKVNHIVTTSAPLLQTSETLLPYHAKTSIIPIGIDPADYPLPDTALLQKWQAQLGLEFALFIGVLRHYKGLHTLIEAAKQTTLPIIIAGGGPLYAELQKQIQDNQLSHVHLIGKVSDADKIALLSLCNMVILPSENRAEAFGVSLLEGMLFKKPLISTELGTGTSFVNQEGQTGFVIPPGNANILAEKINFLQQNPTIAKEMGHAAHARFIKEFQSVIMGERYFELYADLLK